MKLRGLLAISCLVALPAVTIAGQQFKFVDLAPPSSANFTTGIRSVAIHEVTSGGVITGSVAGVNSSGQTIGRGVILSNSGIWTALDIGVAGIGTNAQGDIVYNGGYGPLNYFNYYTGGTVRYADGTTYALPPLGTNPYACARDINDSGVVVGHYSWHSISNYVEFGGGQPFYMKNGVITKPMGDSFYGTFCSVDSHGRAFLNTGGY